MKATFAPTEVRNLARSCASELSRKVAKAQLGNGTLLGNIDSDREELKNYEFCLSRWL